MFDFVLTLFDAVAGPFDLSQRGLLGIGSASGVVRTRVSRFAVFLRFSSHLFGFLVDYANQLIR